LFGVTIANSALASIFINSHVTTFRSASPWGVHVTAAVNFVYNKTDFRLFMNGSIDAFQALFMNESAKIIQSSIAR
jgi:hypothetical protein